jgi:CubicO group peptidase (beta-lactamase class C family)
MGLHIKKLFPFPACLLFLFLLPSCYAFRAVLWRPVGIKDIKRFPSDSIRNQSPGSSFHHNAGNIQLVIPAGYPADGNATPFDEFLENSNTLAFLVIRNDTLIYSKYFQGHGRSSVFPSFSVAKSFISALTGIAIEEGYIRNLDQPVSDFFPELEKKGYGKVTIRDLLSMRAGIDFKEEYKDPFGDVAKLYYGKNSRKFILGLDVITEPGATYYYQSGNTQLLSMVLEKATGKRVSDYLEAKIWKPAGMSFPATWSLDSERHREVKAFCCINASAEDFARFGELFTGNGYYQGRKIVPENWVKETLTIQSDSRDSRGYPYTYFWRVRENGEFFAYGVMGQYIYGCPSKNTVIVRLGAKAGKVDWPLFLHLLLPQL